MIDPRHAATALAALLMAQGLAAGEPANPQVLLTCTMQGKQLEVTASNGFLTYSYGRAGKPELVIRRAFTDAALGHRYELWPRAEHRHLRFHNAGYDYVVFHRFSAPSYNREPGEDRQGLLVLNGSRVIMRRHCDSTVTLDQSFNFTRLHQDERDLTELAGRDPFTTRQVNRP